MDFYDYLKSHLESKICPILHKKPMIEKVDGKMKMQFCCDEFKKDCQKEILQLLIKPNQYEDK